jgi:hypothetical protein
MKVTTLLAALFAFILTIAARAGAAEVHASPLGFQTLDVTPKSWSEMNPEYRFKGKLGDTLRFGEIEDIYVLRIFMHVRDSADIEKTVEWAIAPDPEFLSGPLPERLTRLKEPALLTVMFKTRKGVIGLVTIYSGITIVEMNSRYGAVANQQR